MNKNQKNSSASTNISLYFGSKHQATLSTLDDIASRLKTSRTGAIHFLILHYRWFDRHKPFLAENGF